MAEPTLARWHAPPSLLLPPIGEAPASGRRREVDPVGALADRAVPHGRVRRELPGRVTVALWIVLLGAVGVGSWLTAVRAGVATGGGLVYDVATLWHPGVLLVLAAVCAITLPVLAVFTGGLRRADGPELAALCVAGAAGAVSLLGVALLALLTVAAGLLLLAAIVLAFER